MASFPMPFHAVPCSIWLAHESEPDEWNNVNVEYSDEPDIVTTCVYAPGTYFPNTYNDIEDGRPTGVRAELTFFFKKSLDCDMRGALISCSPPGDATLASKRFKVVGTPFSFPRQDTPGDYSWCVEAVTFLG